MQVNQMLMLPSAVSNLCDILLPGAFEKAYLAQEFAAAFLIHFKHIV